MIGRNVKGVDFAEWAAQQRADIVEVVMQTIRDDIGISYGVAVALRSLRKSAFEEGEDQLMVWTHRVEFGQDDMHVGGGPAFVEAARYQQQVADTIASQVWL